MDRQRRKILELGLGGLGIIGGAIACSPIRFSEPQDESDKKIVIPPMKLSSTAYNFFTSCSLPLKSEKLLGSSPLKV